MSFIEAWFSGLRPRSFKPVRVGSLEPSCLIRETYSIGDICPQERFLEKDMISSMTV